MKYICTYFNKAFLSRGERLIASLDQFSDDYTLYILAMDESTYKHLQKMNHKSIRLISFEDYVNQSLVDQSKFKSEKERLYTITPGLCLYLIQNFSEIDLLVYLDADVCIYNDINILYNEIGSSSISMCDHRLPWFTKPFILVQTFYSCPDKNKVSHIV